MSRDRFDDELRAVIRRAVPRDAPDPLRDRVLDATEQPTAAASRFSFAWRVAAGVAAVAVVLVAAYVGYNLLLGTTPAPASSPSPSGAASASPQPTPFTAAAWELRSLPAPPGHPDFVVHGVSPDGSVVLFGDAGVYDHLYVERDGQVSEISVPGHESGNALAGRLSPSGAFAVVEDANHLFRYDVASAQTKPIAGPPGVTAIDTFVFTSENSLAALSGPIITPIGGGPTNTQLWVLNLTTGDWARQGDRHDAVGLLSTDAGPVLVVDASAAHDNSGWHLYLVQPDGSDSLLYDASGSAYVAVSPDGRSLAVSRGEFGADGTWLIDLVSGATSEVSPGGMVQGFAPDASQFSVLYQSDGHIEAFDLSGTRTVSLASGATAAWVGVPASSSEEPSPSPTPGQSDVVPPADLLPVSPAPAPTRLDAAGLQAYASDRLAALNALPADRVIPASVILRAPLPPTEVALPLLAQYAMTPAVLEWQVPGTTIHGGTPTSHLPETLAGQPDLEVVFAAGWGRVGDLRALSADPRVWLVDPGGDQRRDYYADAEAVGLFALAGQATATVGDWRLTLQVDHAQVSPDVPITVRTTLTYTGSQPTYVAWGAGSGLVTFGLAKTDGSTALLGGGNTACAPYDFSQNQSVSYAFVKPGDVLSGDPQAAWVQAFLGDPEFRLPAGTWDLSASAWFTPGGGDCSADALRLTTGLRLEVTP